MTEKQKAEKAKREIRNDIIDCRDRCRKALDFFDADKLEDAAKEMEEVATTSDFVVSELELMEEKEDTKGVGAPPEAPATETTPPPEPAPPAEQVPA